LPSTSVAVASRDPVAAVQSLSTFLRRTFWAELDSATRRARVRDPEAWDLVWRAQERSDDAEQAILVHLDEQGFHALDIADSLLAAARRKDGESDLIPVEQAHIADLRAFYVEFLRQNLPNLPATLPDPVALREHGIVDLDRLIARRHGPADACYMRGRLKEGLYRSLKTDSLLAGAIADYRSATDLDHGSVTAWKDLASAYLSAGLHADALLANQHAFDADAFLRFTDELERQRFDASLLADQAPSADSACHRGLTASPPNLFLLDCEVESWSRTGRDRRLASAARARVNALAAGSVGTVVVPLRELWVAQILARAGMEDSADRVARRATAGTPPAWQELLLPEEAYLRILRHDPDSALTLIATALRGDATLRPVLRSAPWFASLRADPRFAALVGRGQPR